MSKAELERFSSDIRDDKALHDKVAKQDGDAAAIAHLAKAHGYDVALADVEAAIAEGNELTEEQLDAVAGGQKSVRVISPVVVLIISPVAF